MYTGLGAGFGRGDGQALKWPTLQHLNLFFFLCVNLVLWLNAMFYALDSFCFRLFFSFGSDCECESWEVEMVMGSEREK